MPPSMARTRLTLPSSLDDRPLTISRAFLDERYKMASRYLLRRWAETWYTYSNAKYVPLKDEAFLQPLYQWSHDRLLQKTNPKGTVKPGAASRATTIWRRM